MRREGEERRREAKDYVFGIVPKSPYRGAPSSYTVCALDSGVHFLCEM